MHKGAAKTWYIIPPKYKEDFDKVIKDKYQKLFEKNPGLLYNITLIISPLELLERGVPIFRTEQKPREYIITFPKAYHAGFSHGYNVSEAVNIATPEWIPFAENAVQVYSKEGFLRKTTFPFEWIIVENAIYRDDMDLTNEAKEHIVDQLIKIKNIEMKSRWNVLNNSHKITLKELDCKKMRYDAYCCSQCRNYCYLSFLTCTRCEKKSCIIHSSCCSCLNPNVIMCIRYTEKQLKEIINGTYKGA